MIWRNVQILEGDIYLSLVASANIIRPSSISIFLQIILSFIQWLLRLYTTKKKKEVKNIIDLLLSLRLYKTKPLKTTTVQFALVKYLLVPRNGASEKVRMFEVCQIECLPLQVECE